MAYLAPPSSPAAAQPPADFNVGGSEPDRKEAAKRKDTRNSFIERCRAARHEILRSWLENCLFYIGLQWLAPLPDGRGFMRANLRRDVPRPVTNRFKAILDAIDAPLSRLEPALTCVPESGKDDDRMTADLGIRVLDYLSEQIQLDRLKGEISKILVTCNNCYVHLGLDPAAGGTIRVPQWQCMQCGKTVTADKAAAASGRCDECGGPMRQSSEAVTAMNEGALFAEAVTPFETWVDFAVPRMEDQPIVMIRRLRPRKWAEATWPEHAAAIKNLPSCSSSADLGMTFLQSLIRLAPGGSPTMGGIGFGAPVRWQESILDDILYVKPCSEYPEGLYMRVLGDELEVEVLPLGEVANNGTMDEPGVPFIPVIHYGYDDIPGSHVCTGPADHLKDLQRQRNRREAAIELYFQRMANGVWLIPEGTDVQTPIGEEGWVMRYSPLGSSGAKPERVEGNRLPTSFVEWLQFTDKQMEDIAGTYDLFRGERPPNVSSGYAMQILTERAQARFAHVYGNYEVAHATLGRMMFLLFRNHAPETIYFKIKGEESRWTVVAIQRADIRGGIDFRVESGSARPKTTLEKKASVEQVIQLGLLGPQDMADPDLRLQLLHLYGVPELMPMARVEDEQIAREHMMYLEWCKLVNTPDGQPIPGLTPEQMMLPVLVDALLDDHQFHIPRHKKFQLSPEFLQTPDWCRKAFRMGHYMEHLYEAQMDMMQQAQQPAPPVIGPPEAGQKQQPGPEPGQGAGASAGPARAQGQANAMQNGGGIPGGAQARGQQMAEATPPP